MAQEWPNTGVLFKNDRKEKDRDRDYNGDAHTTCSCCGQEQAWWLSAWIKQGRKGKFLSLSLKAKDEKPAKPGAAATASAAVTDEDIPF